MAIKKQPTEERGEERKERIETRAIVDEMRESYLDYAMSVIVSRALPDVRDGLKPVQRRILWAMWSDGLTHSARFRKSANVVGVVLGRYHPHGDSSVYEALARMAQDFSLRYPLIKGQGNWGSIDGDSPAAMRYTECRLTKIAEELLIDIDKETVDWRPNYDDTRTEPICLPGKIPGLLLNGTMGIAVGMATNMPPHNLTEVVDATMHVIDNPDASIRDVMKYILGPDFPTGGVMYGRENIEKAYATGRGSVTVRAVAEVEPRSGGGYQIVVREIPYQVVKARLLEKIALLVQNKKLEGVRDVRDESDRDGLRVVIELKQDTNPQRVLNFLFQHTELQKNFNFNMVTLIDGLQPQVVSLLDILQAHIEHRKKVIRRRTEFNLMKAEERAHILEGLSKAIKVIDKVIATIKKSKDKHDAHKNLVKQFKLSARQTDAILEMRLQMLAALESKQIENELKEKKKIIAELRGILKDPKKILEIMKQELQELKKSYGDERRTKINVDETKEFKQEDFVLEQEVVILLTHDGYIKRIPPDIFRAQGRGGRGMKGLNLREEDKMEHLVAANTHDNLLFFTNNGKVFQTRAYEVPKATRTAKGKLIHSFLGLSDKELVTALLRYPEKKNEKDVYLVMATEQGVIKKVVLEDFQNVRRNGIIAISLKPDDRLRWVRFASSGDEVLLVTRKGQAIRFKEKDIRAMGRSATGVRGITLKKDDQVTSLDIIEKDDQKGMSILVITEKGYGKQTTLDKYKVQRRGGSGIKTAAVTNKTGGVVAARLVSKKISEVLAFSANGHIIKTELKSIRVAGRATQGVRVMRLGVGDSVVGIICL